MLRNDAGLLNRYRTCAWRLTNALPPYVAVGRCVGAFAGDARSVRHPWLGRGTTF